uniref:Integrase catalytic domain-containing protein n=1 Tax=Ascaris lumbricoides TaxID=6252 RepID=A0A0M3IK21_ASCLU
MRMDFAGLIMFLVRVDAHSMWPELKTILHRFDFPKVPVSDNRTPFTTLNFALFCATVPYEV